jgi:hypothetical protein
VGLKNHMERRNSYLTCISLGFMHIDSQYADVLSLGSVQPNSKH